jgi:N-dimethylarginine dimethylaminohydrolase
LLPNMKPEHRAGERELWKEAAEALGMLPVSVRGTWEAQGDVAFFRGRTLLFFGGRTTRDGALDAATHFGHSLPEPLYVEIQQPAFHGNMAALPLPAADRLLVCHEVLVDRSLARLESAFGKKRVLAVSVEEVRAYATNGLPIGGDVLAPHLTPLRVLELLRSLGLSVVLLPMTELCEKAGGASRCLVSHATVEAEQVQIPASLDYRARRAELVGRLPGPLRRNLE